MSTDNIKTKLVNIELFDGIPKGFRQVEFETEIIKAVVVPRAQAGEIASHINEQTMAVYLLLGQDDSGELKIYVGADTYYRQDSEQVWDYALDLKNFYEGSRDLVIVPVLIASEAPDSSATQTFSLYDDQVFEPILCNADGLACVITSITHKYANNVDLRRWAYSRYMPTPTIIQAASSLYLNHSVEDITRSEASSENLKQTSDFVMRVIEHSQTNNEKSICFVTGVPGAGKMLVGLNIAVRQFANEEEE